jgi:hypothetical protein
MAVVVELMRDSKLGHDGRAMLFFSLFFSGHLFMGSSYGEEE